MLIKKLLTRMVQGEENDIQLVNSLLLLSLLIFLQLVTSDPEYAAYRSEYSSQGDSEQPRPGPSVVQEFIKLTQLAEKQLRT